MNTEAILAALFFRGVQHSQSNVPEHLKFQPAPSQTRHPAF